MHEAAWGCACGTQDKVSRGGTCLALACGYIDNRHDGVTKSVKADWVCTYVCMGILLCDEAGRTHVRLSGRINKMCRIAEEMALIILRRKVVDGRHGRRGQNKGPPELHK